MVKHLYFLIFSGLQLIELDNIIKGIERNSFSYWKLSNRLKLTLMGLGKQWENIWFGKLRLTFACCFFFIMLPIWTACIDIFRSLSCIRKSGFDPSLALCARICHFYVEFFSRIYCRTSTTLLKNSDYYIQDLK